MRNYNFQINYYYTVNWWKNWTTLHKNKTSWIHLLYKVFNIEKIRGTLLQRFFILLKIFFIPWTQFENVFLTKRSLKHLDKQCRTRGKRMFYTCHQASTKANYLKNSYCPFSNWEADRLGNQSFKEHGHVNCIWTIDMTSRQRHTYISINSQ